MTEIISAFVRCHVVNCDTAHFLFHNLSSNDHCHWSLTMRSAHDGYRVMTFSVSPWGNRSWAPTRPGVGGMLLQQVSPWTA